MEDSESSHAATTLKAYTHIAALDLVFKNGGAGHMRSPRK